MSYVYVTAKCSDCCHIEFEDEEREGYLPHISGLGGDDYIKLIIENETGRLIGWNPITGLSQDEIQ